MFVDEDEYDDEDDETTYTLVRIKRKWVPEWLFRIYAHYIPPWVWPFRQILTVKVGPE